MDATWIAFAFLCRWGGISIIQRYCLPYERSGNVASFTCMVVAAAAMPWLLLTKAK